MSRSKIVPSATKGVILTVSMCVATWCVSGGGKPIKHQSVNDLRSTISIVHRPGRVQIVTDSNAVKIIQFQNLVKQWREERGATSSLTKAAMMPAYLQIIGMGPKAVPLIIAQMRSERDDPDQWFWALESITGVDPTKEEDQGDNFKLAQSWFKWDEENNAIRFDAA